MSKVGRKTCVDFGSSVWWRPARKYNKQPFVRGTAPVSQSSADSLLGEIEAFCRRTGIAESTFGRQAVNDGKLCVRLRNGKDVTLETAAKIRGFIEGQPAAETLNGAEHIETNNKGTNMSANVKRKPALLGS